MNLGLALLRTLLTRYEGLNVITIGEKNVAETQGYELFDQRFASFNLVLSGTRDSQQASLISPPINIV
jgi:hypothetical protein